jgi:hypothetical protein
MAAAHAQQGQPITQSLINAHTLDRSLNETRNPYWEKNRKNKKIIITAGFTLKSLPDIDMHLTIFLQNSDSQDTSFMLTLFTLCKLTAESMISYINKNKKKSKKCTETFSQALI